MVGIHNVAEKTTQGEFFQRKKKEKKRRPRRESEGCGKEDRKLAGTQTQPKPTVPAFRT